MAPNCTGSWVEAGGRRYWVEVDRDRELQCAYVEVNARDKATTLRRLKHPVTLAKLQRQVRPAPRCEHCGSEIAA